METLIDKLLDILVGLILMKIAYEFHQNPQKIRSIRDSVIFLFISLSMIPRAILFKESRVQVRLYGDQHLGEKQTVGKWMDFYLWHIQRRLTVYFFPLAMMFLVWADPKLEPIDTPLTYLILCGMSVLLRKMFDWAKSDLDKRMA